MSLMPTRKLKAYDRGFVDGFRLGQANGLRLAGVVLGKTHLLAEGKVKKISRRKAA